MVDNKSIKINIISKLPRGSKCHDSYSNTYVLIANNTYPVSGGNKKF